jgi:hypothetical protein
MPQAAATNRPADAAAGGVEAIATEEEERVATTFAWR